MNPLQEFVVLLDFDLGYPEDKMRRFESTCADINCIKANLMIRFCKQQYGDIDDSEKENKKLLESIFSFVNTIKTWSKTEKETTKIAYIASDWYKRARLKTNEKTKKKD